jgi:hypothetical protein
LVFVAPLELHMDVTDANLHGRRIDLVRPGYYGQPEAFVDLVRESIPGDGLLYDWRRISVSDARPIRVVFPGERRYIAFPVFIVPLGPSDDAARSRTIFVWLQEDADVYRVTVVGKKVVTERANLSKAHIGAGANA